MAEFEIRRVEPGDGAGLARVHACPKVMANTLQVPYPSAASWTERLARFGPEDVLLVAVVGGEPIGAAGLHLNPGRRRAHAAGLHVGVADDHQGRGIGSALVAELVRMADGWLNLLRIELTVFEDNLPALALYRRHGFVIEGTHRGFAFRDGLYVDALAMARLHPRMKKELRPTSLDSGS